MKVAYEQLFGENPIPENEMIEHYHYKAGKNGEKYTRNIKVGDELVNDKLPENALLGNVFTSTAGNVGSIKSKVI